MRQWSNTPLIATLQASLYTVCFRSNIKCSLPRCRYRVQVRDLDLEDEPWSCQGELATAQPATVQESSAGCGGCSQVQLKAIDL